MFSCPFWDLRATPPAPLAVLQFPDGRRGPRRWKPGRPRPATPRHGGREGSGLPEDSGGNREGATRTRAESRTQPQAGAHPGAPPRSTFGEGYSGVLGVDGVEDALVADLRFGDKADLAADVRGAPAHGAAAAPGR